MPEFQDVAAHFDQDPVVDGYTGEFLFFAQFNSFDEAGRDGSIVKKRTMSMRPDLLPPPRRLIEFVGERWLVGDGNKDIFQGDAVRAAFWMKKTTDSAQFGTPGELLAGSLSHSAWVHLEYLKDTVNGITDSQYDPFWNIYTAPNEPIQKGTFIAIGGTLYRVRAEHRELNGLKLSESDEIDRLSQVAVKLTTGSTFDPLTEKWTGTETTVPGLLIDMYKLYNFKTEADAKMHSGDMTLLLSDSVPVGTQVTIGDQLWQILATQPELDAYNHHVRRA